MTNEEKVNRIQSVIDHPGNEGLYYKLLEDMGDLKGDYGDYMTTEPINCDIELKRLPTADYELATALLTMLLREDHFDSCSLMRRFEAGQVDAVLRRMIETL